MRAVLLDATTLGMDIDLEPLRECVDNLEVHPTSTPDEVAERLRGARIALTNKAPIDQRAIEAAPELELICVLATGINNIDLDAARRAGIEVRNVSAYGTASVAQHTMALILGLATQLNLVQRDLALGAWQRSPHFSLFDRPIVQLAGKRLTIVGQGELGSEVARLAQAFGMHVTFAARPGSANDPRPPLDTLLPESDVVSLHCPLNDQTRGLIDSHRLALLKPGALLINCARGGVIDELAALEALRRGTLGGLAVDTLPEEPPRAGHALLDALSEELNLLVTPHSAWAAPEARARIVELTADNIRAHFAR